MDEHEPMIPCNRKSRSRHPGFSILEMVIATAVLMVGILAVVQLVPASLQSNLNNRVDTTATVIAQREFDQILGQSLASPSFKDLEDKTIQLGSSTASGTFGSPMTTQGSFAVIDFTAALVDGYNKQYVDPNDSAGALYELRWGVITTANNGAVFSKRFVLGCRRLGAPNGVMPVNLDSIVYAF